MSPRSTKPRKQGLTGIGDDGDPVPWIRDMLEVWGDYVDSVKFVPALLFMPHRVVEERVKLYRDHGLAVALDDPIFAIAYYQGKAEQLLRNAYDMGFTHCQIDTHHVNLADAARMKKADEDQIRLSKLALDIGLKLWGEVGQKQEEGDKARASAGRRQRRRHRRGDEAADRGGLRARVPGEPRFAPLPSATTARRRRAPSRSRRSCARSARTRSTSRSPTRCRSRPVTAIACGRFVCSAPMSTSPAAPR